MKLAVLFLILLLMVSHTGAQAEVSLQRVTRSYTQHLLAPPEKILPLLTPIRESEWADGWKADMIYPSSGEAGPGCIFTTHSGENKAIWTMTAYDPEHFRVEYFLIHPDHHARQIRIVLTKHADITTSAQISYTYTALDSEGNRAVSEFTEEKWHHQMIHWEMALNHYLTTGQRMTDPE